MPGALFFVGQLFKRVISPWNAVGSVWTNEKKKIQTINDTNGTTKRVGVAFQMSHASPCFVFDEEKAKARFRSREHPPPPPSRSKVTHLQAGVPPQINCGAIHCCIIVAILLGACGGGTRESYSIIPCVPKPFSPINVSKSER